MQAALPHVDHFLAGNSLASLEELAELMEGAQMKDVLEDVRAWMDGASAWRSPRWWG